MIPVRTLVVVLAATGTSLIPALASVLMYDRNAVFAGAVWQTLTGVLVHWTVEHLLFNLAAFAAAGWVIERRGYPHFWLVGGLTALTGSAVLLAASPEISRYGGLSGIAVGLIVYASVCGMREEGPWRHASTMVFALTLLKVAVELLTGRTPLTAVGAAPFIPVPMVHAIGVLVGVLVALGSAPEGRRSHRSSGDGASARTSVTSIIPSFHRGGFIKEGHVPSKVFHHH